MKQNQKKGNIRAGKGAALCCFLSAASLGTVSLVYADKFSAAAKSAAEGIQASAAGATKWILAGVMVIIGLVFLVGTQQQKEQTKSGIFIKLIGVALIVGAVSYSGIIFGWFE